MGILKDGTRPRLASWIAWFLANVVMAVIAFLSHAHLAVVFDILSALGNAGVLLASAVRGAGQRPTGQSDWICLSAAVFCSVLILFFPQWALLSACLAMGANTMATWPTMQHAWHEPFAETWQLFAANAGASMLALASVLGSSGMDMCAIAGPLIAMLGNLALTSITLVRRYGDQIAEEVHEDIVELEEELAPTKSGLLD
jgi:hypothetical protein